MHRLNEPARVRVFPLIEAEGVFVEVAEQVERINGDVGAFDAAFEQAPEVFKSVGVNAPVNVGFHVVNKGVLVVGGKLPIGGKGVGENLRALQELWQEFDRNFPGGTKRLVLGDREKNSTGQPWWK